MPEHRSLRSLALVGALCGFVATSVGVASAAPAELSAKAESAKKTDQAAKTPAGENARKGSASVTTSADGIKTYTASASGVTMQVRSFTLDNGLRVYVLEDHSTPVVAVHVAYNVGSRDEKEGRTGFAHLFEHMMFKGSKNVPEGGHFDYVLSVGGDLNAFTTADVTQYFNVVPSHYLERVLWLESDRMRSLEVTDENFENQRKAVQEEKAMRIDNVPYTGALLQFFAEAWKGTGYGHLVIGSDEDLAAAETEDVKAFFDTYYVPNNAVLSIVGDVDFATVRDQVQQYFGDIPRGKDREPFGPVDHTQTRIEERVEDPLAQQPLYLVGWKTVPEDHADRHAVELLMNTLLRGDSGRITRILKDEKKLVVTAVPMPSFLGGGRDAGAALGAFIPVQGVTFEQIEKVVLEEVENVKKKGISRKELDKAKNQLLVDTMSSLATNNGRAELIAQGALFYDDPTYVLTDLEKYRAVTLADIKRVAGQYLTDKWMVLEIAPKR